MIQRWFVGHLPVHCLKQLFNPPFLHLFPAPPAFFFFFKKMLSPGPHQEDEFLQSREEVYSGGYARIRLPCPTRLCGDGGGLSAGTAQVRDSTLPPQSNESQPPIYSVM